MLNSRYSEEQFVRMWREHEAGVTTGSANSRSIDGNLRASTLVSDQPRDTQMLKELLEKSGDANGTTGSRGTSSRALCGLGTLCLPARGSLPLDRALEELYQQMIRDVDESLATGFS